MTDEHLSDDAMERIVQARHARSEVERKRLEAFKALLDRYGVEASIYDTECEEDPRPYLSGAEPCGRYVCVTMHGEKPFFLPKFDDIELAVARAVEYVADDIFAETPAEIVDLDTGDVRVPDWSKLPWTRKRTGSA